MSHWKVYEPIEVVPVFDEHGAGPEYASLHVIANLHPSKNYPENRITIGLGDLATGGLTVEQSARLRAVLEQAENDVKRGSDRSVEVDDG